MKQDAKTSSSHEVSAPEFPFNQSASSIPSKILPEVEILEEGFARGKHAPKRRS